MGHRYSRSAPPIGSTRRKRTGQIPLARYMPMFLLRIIPMKREHSRACLVLLYDVTRGCAFHYTMEPAILSKTGVWVKGGKKPSKQKCTLSSRKPDTKAPVERNT